MLLFIGLILVIVFGYFVSVILVEKLSLPERLGLSFLIGFGLFTLFMFCYSTAGIKITTSSTLIALGIFNCVTFVLLKLFKRKIYLDIKSLGKTIKSLSVIEKIVIVVIFTFVVFSLIISTYYPIYIWDALALYDFRAKIIADMGFYTQIASKYVYFTGYPLFTSLSHTLVYLFKVNNPQFLYSLMYGSYILVFYGAMKEMVSRKIALLFTLVLVTTPVFFDHSTFAYTNLPYSIFVSMGSIYLYVWYVKKKPLGYLILSAIMTGLSCWTRSAEPFWMINIFVLLILTAWKFKKNIVALLSYVFVFLLIKQPWTVISHYLLNNPGVQKTNLVSSEVNYYSSVLLKTPFDPIRILIVGQFIYKYIITSWYPLIFLFVFIIFTSFRKRPKSSSTLFLFLILFNFCLLVYATYVFSVRTPSWDTIPDSARRMAMFFIPMMIYYVGLVFHELTDEK